MVLNTLKKTQIEENRQKKIKKYKLQKKSSIITEI